MRGMILHIRNAKNLQADVDYLELKDLLNPSDFDGDDRPECLENTRKETLDSIYTNGQMLVGIQTYFS